MTFLWAVQAFLCYWNWQAINVARYGEANLVNQPPVGYQNDESRWLHRGYWLEFVEYWEGLANLTSTAQVVNAVFILYLMVGD
jgi:hypothetical protein